MPNKRLAFDTLLYIILSINMLVINSPTTYATAIDDFAKLLTRSNRFMSEERLLNTHNLEFLL